jgi:hypothetical protein
MENNSQFVDSLLKDLKNTSKYLSEAYIFDEHGEEMPMEHGMEPGMEGGMQQPDPTVPQQQAAAAQQGDNVEAQAMHAQEVIKHEPIIGKIRETAIEGLKKYADNPTSKLYEFFKKVFLESDKVLTDTGSKN